MKRERPAGVTVIAVLSVIGSIFAILGAVAILGSLALVNNIPAGTDPDVVKQLETVKANAGLLNIVAIVTLVTSVAGFVAALGLFRMASWGLWGTIILNAINIILVVLGGGAIIGLSNIIGVVVIAYLFTQREKFA